MEDQLEAHFESMMEDNVQPSFGIAIDEGQWRGNTLGFQHSSLKRHADKAYIIMSPPLHTGLREATLSKYTIEDDKANNIEQHELSTTLHKPEELVPSTRYCAFDPYFGIGWHEVLSWYLVEQCGC